MNEKCIYIHFYALSGVFRISGKVGWGGVKLSQPLVCYAMLLFVLVLRAMLLFVLVLRAMLLFVLVLRAMQSLIGLKSRQQNCVKQVNRWIITALQIMQTYVHM